MDRILQVAGRANKSPIGFQIQLVVHRLKANLPACKDTDLVAMLIRKKKKIVTQSAAYQGAVKEVVWGDILPFSTTLYLAKTGLFQAKMYTLNVYNAQTDQLIATVQFNLAQAVQNTKQSVKESITIPVTKCQDPRASISITVFSARVWLVGKQEICEIDSALDEEHVWSDSSSDYSSSRPPSPVKVTDTKTIPSDIEKDIDHAVLAAKLESAESIEKYRGTIRELEQRLRETEHANGYLESTIERNAKVIQEIERQNQELELQKQLSDSIEPLEIRSNGTMDVHALLRENQDLLQIITRMKSSDVPQSIAQRTQSEAAVSIDQDEFTRVSAELESLQLLVQQQFGTIASLEADKIGLVSQIQELKALLNAQEGEIKDAQSIQQSMKNKDVAIARLRTAQDEKKALSEQLIRAEQDALTSRSDRNAARTLLHQAELQCEEERKKCAQAQLSISDLQSRVQDEIANSKIAEEAFRRGKLLFVETKRDRDALQLQVDILKTDLKSCHEMQHELQREINAMKDQAQIQSQESQRQKEESDTELILRSEQLHQALESYKQIQLDFQVQLTLDDLKFKTHEAQTNAKDVEIQSHVSILEQENGYYQRELIDSKMKLAELTEKSDDLYVQCKKLERAIQQRDIDSSKAKK